MANVVIVRRLPRVQLVRPCHRTHRHHPIPILKVRPIEELLLLPTTTMTSSTQARVAVQPTVVTPTGLLRPPPTHSLPTYRNRVPPAPLRPQKKPRRVVQPGTTIVSRIAPIPPHLTLGSPVRHLGPLLVRLLPTRPNCPLPLKAYRCNQ
jgi:hypothetical protein